MTGRTDTASRRISAPAEVIYRALTDAEARIQWLPPTGMTARLERFDLRVGGGYRMVLTFADPSSGAGKSTADSDVVEATFVELVEGERVAEEIEFESDDPAFAGTMTMTWQLTPLADGTEVSIVASGVPAGNRPGRPRNGHAVLAGEPRRVRRVILSRDSRGGSAAGQPCTPSTSPRR